MDVTVPVVLRFRDGRVVHMSVPDSEAPAPVLFATDAAGEELEILLSSLKGVFYLQQPRERLLGIDRPSADAPSGTMATVEFEDGEVLTGRVRIFDPTQPGFFIYPVDPQGNNAKIYVVTAAVRSLELRP